MHMSRMSTVLTEERGNNTSSRFRHKTAIDHQDIDHQDIDSQESDLILADVLCQELVTLECCTRAEPTENTFETRKIACDREDVISEPSMRTVVGQKCSTTTFQQRSRNQRQILHHCEVDPCQTLS